MAEADAERAIVDKAARAIYEARNGKGCVPWSRIGGGHQGPYRADARAALGVFDQPLDQLAGLVAGTHVVVSAEPGHIYDPSDDEGIVPWADRLDLTDYLEVGEVQHLKTLIAGPDKWAALVALTIDEDGYADQTEIVFFNTEAAAMAAVGRPQPEGDRRG